MVLVITTDGFGDGINSQSSEREKNSGFSRS